MNQNWKTHFEYYWWKYLAVLIAAIVLWNGLFTALAQPEENEKLTVACFTPDVDIQALRSNLEAHKDSVTEQPLKEVSVEAYLDYASSSMYFSYALASADVFVFSEEMVVPDEQGNVPVTYKGLFKPIPMDTFAEVLGDKAQGLKLFGDDSGIYGVYLNPEGQVNRFTEVCENKTSCILFFNPDSVNLNGLYGKGNTEDGAAIDLLLYLIGITSDHESIGEAPWQ